jgi:hypothetical protein
MKVKWNLNRRVFGLACVVAWVGLQTRVLLLPASSDPLRSFSNTNASPNRRCARGATLDQPGTPKATAVETHGSLPLTFEANCGQAKSQVKFLSHGSDYDLYLTAKEAVIEIRAPTSPSSQSVLDNSANTDANSSLVRLKLLGANDEASIDALDELPAKSNYFVGNDPKKWRTNVANYARVESRNVYPGIDMVYYGHSGQLQYDFNVAPGANPESIRLSFEGADTIQINSTADLEIGTSAGRFRQPKPVVYQQLNGARKEIECRYALNSEREVGFAIANYDPGEPLTIDPVLSYSTYLGGKRGDEALGIAVDSSGNAYVTGRTTSPDFPTVPGAFQRALSKDNFIVFITKINSSGTAIDYSTYLGGSQSLRFGDSGDQGLAIAVDAAGSAYVTGETSSLDFPTTPGALRSTPLVDPFIDNNTDAFVTKLNATGSALVYSTYLGGLHPGFEAPVGSVDVGRSIAVDSDGNAYVAGQTDSADFPVANALQPRRLSVNSAFVSKLNPTGSALVYSTYLGGENGDTGASSIAADAVGNAYVAGTTRSAAFPVTANAFQSSLSGSSDAFVAKIDARGTTLVYSTYLGGHGDDETGGIAIDRAGNAYVTGRTSSTDFPTVNPLQRANASGPVFKTTDGGTTWISINAGLNAFGIYTLVIDPSSPSTVYAASGVDGVFKSTNGGSSWISANAGLPADLRTVVVDPVTPSTLYAGLSVNGVYKSANGGATWSATGLTGSGSNAKSITALAIDPTNTATIYAGGIGFGAVQLANANDSPSPSPAIPPLQPNVLYKSTDGGSTWRIVDTGLPRDPGLQAIAIDPTMTATLFAAAATGVFKSEDAAGTWTNVDPSDSVFTTLAIDPQNTSTIYAGSFAGLFKSGNAGRRWREVGEPLASASIQALATDRTNTSIIYASAFPGVFKSTDGGGKWSGTGLTGGLGIFALAIDPVNSSTLYAATTARNDAFITKLNASGTALLYSTYLGGRNDDLGVSIAVDDAGNATLTGVTASEDFPVKNALQSKINGPNSNDAFITRLTVTGAVSYSTFFGGKGTDGGDCVALDRAGNAYVSGFTDSANLSTQTPLQAEFGGGLDGFVLKIALPRIIAVIVSGKMLIVAGEAFAQGAVVLLNGEEQKTKNDETKATTMLVARRAGKSIAPGQRVVIQVRNPDGTLSDEFSFVRPVE